MPDTNGNEFYQSLGKLFYAVAMADKKVQPREGKKLRENVRQYWLGVDDTEDEFGTDAAFQIEIVFDWLETEAPADSDYYEEFVAFYKAHPELFSTKIKSLILRTSQNIASSFSGTNKSELLVLGKLRKLLA